MLFRSKQIKNQLSKLEDVVKIFELENSKSVCRELILAKVRANKAVKQEVVTIADIFRAKVVDVSKDNLMIELTGNVNKIEAFINLISDFVHGDMAGTFDNDLYIMSPCFCSEFAQHIEFEELRTVVEIGRAHV